MGCKGRINEMKCVYKRNEIEQIKIKWYHQGLIPGCKLKMGKNPCSIHSGLGLLKPVQLVKRSLGLDPDRHSPSPSTTLL